MSNRIPLPKGSILQQKYIIDRLISDAGSTCLVYKAHPVTKEGIVDLLNPLIIKEFYPQNWVMLSRNAETGQLDTTLAVLQHAFQKEVDNFCAQAEYNNLTGYDREHDSRFASFLHMQGFKENQTGYIVVSSISGVTLDMPEDFSLFPIEQYSDRKKDALVSLIDLILRITDAVEVQHQAGFVNGDLKPDNLLIAKVGESILVHLLDFGSCIPINKAQLRTITPEILRMRLSQTVHYSSDRLSSIYNYIKQRSQSQGADETEIYNVLSKLSPADDVYSICQIFGEMLFVKRDFDAFEEINDLQWLNDAEKSCLHNVFLNGMKVEQETTAKDLRDMLKHLRQVLKREGASKERFWASACDYYEANKGSTAFRTTHKTMIPSAKAECEAVQLIIEGTLNGEDIFPVHDIIQNLGDKNVYIQGLGGAGKSFVAAQLHKKCLTSGRKVPFYLDLVNLEKMEEPGEENGDNIILQLLQQEYGFFYRDAELLLIQLQQCSISPKKDYLLLLDNLHKVEGKGKTLVMALLRTLEENYKNTQFCVLGRGLPQSDDEKECYPEDIIKLIGIPSHMVKNYLDSDQDLFKLPFFFMRALEARIEGRLLDNTVITPAGIMYKYFAGVKGFEGFFKDIQFPALTNELINNVFPRMAYEKRCNRQKWHVEDLMSYINAFFVDQDTVMGVFVDNLGLIECDRDGCLSFTHDCYEEYFGGMYIAQRVYRIVEQSDLYATSKMAKEINYKWEKDLGEYAIQLLNGVYFREMNCACPKESGNHDWNKTMEHAYIHKLSNLLSEEVPKEDWIKECYCKLPMNLCRNYYFDKDRIDVWFHLLEEKDIFECCRESIRKWGQIARLFSDCEGYNLLGMISFREKEYDKSVSLFLQSGEAGCGAAYYNLGMICEMGWDEKESRIFKEGLTYALKNRKRWPMFAYENIRNCSKWIYRKYYANQEEFSLDCNCYFSNQEKTLYWMEKAAEMECEEAFLVLGYLYEYGFNEKYEKWFAKYYYRCAVERGLSAGILPLANLLISDNTFLEHEEVSKAEGEALLYEYAMKGNEVAIRRAIEFLCDGLYYEENYRKAVVLLNKIYDIYADREHSKSLIPDYLADMIERYRTTKSMAPTNAENESIPDDIHEDVLEEEWNKTRKDELARMLEEYDQITQKD